MVASALKNKDVILTGLAGGIIGWMYSVTISVSPSLNLAGLCDLLKQVIQSYRESQFVAVLDVECLADIDGNHEITVRNKHYAYACTMMEFFR